MLNRYLIVIYLIFPIPCLQAKDWNEYHKKSEAHLSHDHKAFRTLMMVHPKILNHDHARAGGPWSFGSLLMEVAKAHFNQVDVSPEQYNEFVRNWLQSLYSSRPGIKNHVTCLWATGQTETTELCDSELLSPDQAPFKLLAINYRPDFAKNACTGEEGEFRFTFGLTRERPEGRHPMNLAGEEMTVIFEYDLSKVHKLDLRPGEWAKTFQDLNDPSLCEDFCDSYIEELEKLTQLISSYHPELTGQKIALGQIRTNEIIGDARFQPELTATLRTVGEALADCYNSLIANPDHFDQGLRACADRISEDRILPITGPLSKVFRLLANISRTNVPLPIPQVLADLLPEALATISNRFIAVWEMREAVLTPEGLQWRSAKDTPLLKYNNTPALAQLIAKHETSILNGSIHFDPVLNKAGFDREVIVTVNPLDGWRFTGQASIYPDMIRQARVQSRFAQLTCGGCHATQTTAIGAVHIVTDVLSHAKRINEIRPLAAELLRVHQQDDLEFENLEGFYMISPLRSPGEDGLGHLARYLTKPTGELTKRITQMDRLARDTSLCSVVE